MRNKSFWGQLEATFITNQVVHSQEINLKFIYFTEEKYIEIHTYAYQSEMLVQWKMGELWL